MTPATLVMAYYENPGMLQRQYAAIRELPQKVRDALHVIIVDDGSPEHPAFAEDLNGVPLQVYRMMNDIRWNQDACRNIGVRHSETEWVLLTDMDHMVPVETWETLLFRDWDRDNAYQFRRVSMPDLDQYKHHPNSWFMARRLFDAIGGYDERFAGFYGTDGDFRDHVSAVAKIQQLKCNIIRVPRTVVPDASTTTYLRKQPEDGKAIGKIKAARSKLPDKEQRPLRYRFEYHRVFPVPLGLSGGITGTVGPS